MAGTDRGAGGAPHEADLAMIRAVMADALSDIAERLGRDSDEVTKDRFLDHMRSALAMASWPSDEYSVRRDLVSAEPTARGAWRFDLLVECPDRVVAAIEVRAEPDDLEGRVMALGRLSLARERGIAQSAFLVAVEPIAASGGARDSTPHWPGLRPVAEAVAVGEGGRRWRLALFEPKASQPS